MKKNNNYNSKIIFISTNFTTNFKPYLTDHLKSFNDLKINNNIYCKNFLIYLLLLKYKNNFVFKSNIYIKKYKKKVYTILRSPYRHKLARHQIHISRYNINHSMFLTLKSIIFINNLKKLLVFIKLLINTRSFFESNLVFIVNIKISVPFKFKFNYLIKNYQNINK